jgi:hypothetical protein
VSTPQPHRSGEPPLEWLTRHGWTVTVYPGLLRANRGEGPYYRLVDGPTARELALSLGWYP